MSKNLLVTDDALIIREIIKDTAVADDWTIVGEATNGQEAIDQYRKLRPDAVTMDIVMPSFDGLHGLRGIIEENPDAKVLIVSAVDHTACLKDAIRMGAADFIVKPFNRQNLLEALNAVVS